MASNRIARINDAIQKELSALLRTVKDPRVAEGMLTITHVDTTSDLRYARVYISALNCPDEKALLKGLKSAAGYLAMSWAAVWTCATRRSSSFLSTIPSPMALTFWIC